MKKKEKKVLTDRQQVLYEQMITFLSIFVDDEVIRTAIKTLDDLVEELL